MLSKLENDHKIYNPYKDRKTQSENGKDKFSKEEDTKLYKYFSNSARYDKNNRRSIVETDLEEETDVINIVKNVDQIFLNHFLI